VFDEKLLGSLCKYIRRNKMNRADRNITIESAPVFSFLFFLVVPFFKVNPYLGRTMILHSHVLAYYKNNTTY
jgi:hypothetical protein